MTGRTVLRRWWVILPLALALLAIGGSMVIAADEFIDVPEDAFYHASATWMLANGITVGCNTEGTKFCPGSAVTRGQMAAFMQRMSWTQVVAGAHVVRTGETMDQASVATAFNNVSLAAPTLDSADFSDGVVVLDFGFDPSDAFLLCTVDGADAATDDNFCQASVSAGDVLVRTVNSADGNAEPANFYVQIFGFDTTAAPAP